jgi:hypothetical protein
MPASAAEEFRKLWKERMWSLPFPGRAWEHIRVLMDSGIIPLLFIRKALAVSEKNVFLRKEYVV